MALQQRVALVQGKSVAQSLGQILSGVAPVVLTGQQPGFAGGPLFVWLKAHSAIVHAERMSSELGLPVRALFWVAGDDSDLDEVRYLSDPVTGLTLDSHPEVGRANLPVGDLPFPDPEALRAWALQAWPRSALSSILDQGAMDLSSLMIACLRHWFGERIVIVDARWPELRGLAHRTYRTFGRSPEKVDRALKGGMTASQAAGLPVAIRSWPDKLRLFRLGTDGARRRVLVREGSLTDDAGWTISPKSFPANLERELDRFSHDVVSRPFAAEEIFPVLAHVLGPGEFAYFSCLGPLSQKIGAPLAPVLPRASCTILPSRQGPAPRMAGWDPTSQPSGPWDPLKMAYLKASHPESVLWAKTWSDARADYLDQLGVGGPHPAIESIGRKLATFESRLHTTRLLATAKDHREDLDSLKHLWCLAGAGGLQERLFSPWALEHHLEQPELMLRLAEFVDPLEPSHVVWEAR